MTFRKQLKSVLITVILTSLITSCDSPSKDDETLTEQKNSINLLKNYKMQLNENKTLVNDFIEAMKTSNVDKLKTMITDDFSWWIIRKPECLATAGEHDTEYLLGFFKGTALFPEGADLKQRQ